MFHIVLNVLYGHVLKIHKISKKPIGINLPLVPYPNVN